RQATYAVRPARSADCCALVSRPDPGERDASCRRMRLRVDVAPAAPRMSIHDAFAAAVRLSMTSSAWIPGARGSGFPIVRTIDVAHAHDYVAADAQFSPVPEEFPLQFLRPARRGNGLGAQRPSLTRKGRAGCARPAFRSLPAKMSEPVIESEAQQAGRE